MLKGKFMNIFRLSRIATVVEFLNRKLIYTWNFYLQVQYWNF